MLSSVARSSRASTSAWSCLQAQAQQARSFSSSLSTSSLLPFPHLQQPRSSSSRPNEAHRNPVGEPRISWERLPNTSSPSTGSSFLLQARSGPPPLPPPSSLRLYSSSPRPPGSSPPPSLYKISTPPPLARPTSPLNYFQRLLQRRAQVGRSRTPYQRVPLPSLRIPQLVILKDHRRSLLPLLLLAIFLITSTASYNFIPASRHFALAILRCTRLMWAVVLDAIDYKRTFAKDFGEDEQRKMKEYRACHLRSAKRMLSALEDLGGIYIKLGQHLSSVAVIPIEWSSTMSVLQDRCPPSSLSEIDAMIKMDTGKSREVYFSDWDPDPIGIASIAQVHLATDRETGQRVAVKLQHPNLEEWSGVDLATVNFAVKWIDQLFPTFRFGWLAAEMNESLPLEMDFRIEAKNAARTARDFADFPECTLYIPVVKFAEKRILVMEYIEGARVDNIEYLDKHNIDRNLVSKELSRMFSQMVYLNGFFHADPHQGNVLIRPKPAQGSRSPYNFEIVLLDHGQYFDLDDQLRVNYAHFWLSLISPNSAKVQAERRKYAKLVGNVGDDLYLILESALTGRIGLGAPNFDQLPDEDANGLKKTYTQQKAGSVMDMETATEEEQSIMRNAVVEREGLLADIFTMLRSVPRRILIVIKLNDLTRSLDKSLETTHGQARVFMIVARYCARAIWQDDLAHVRQRWRSEGLSFSLVRQFLGAFFRFRFLDDRLRMAELWADGKGKMVLWMKGVKHHPARQVGGVLVPSG